MRRRAAPSGPAAFSRSPPHHCTGRNAQGRAAARPGALDELRAPVAAAQATIESDSPDLPLVVYFPTNRSALDIPERIRTPHEFNALSAYDSPQVLSSLHAANVRVVDRFELRMLDRGTWRRDTNRILETAFGDPGRPPEVAAKLNQLRDAVDADHHEEARRLIGELSTMIEGELLALGCGTSAAGSARGCSLLRTIPI